MPRGLDHVVHLTRDLDALAALYRRLGFQVGAQNRHPWGTWNHIVQLPGFFIEALGIGEPEKIVPAAPGTFSFGAFNRDLTAKGVQGLSMLVAESFDPPAERAAFAKAGIGAFAPFDFARKGCRPDGTEIDVAFTLTFAENPRLADTGFFLCHQRFPQNFWNPVFQTHPNSVIALAGVTLVAEDPSTETAFMQAFLDASPPRETMGTLTFATPRGEVKVKTPDAFRASYGTSPEGGLACLRFRVANFGTTLKVLREAQVPATLRMGRLVIGPDFLPGMTMVFEAG